MEGAGRRRVWTDRSAMPVPPQSCPDSRNAARNPRRRGGRRRRKRRRSGPRGVVGCSRVPGMPVFIVRRRGEEKRRRAKRRRRGEQREGGRRTRSPRPQSTRLCVSLSTPPPLPVPFSHADEWASGGGAPSALADRQVGSSLTLVLRASCGDPRGAHPTRGGGEPGPAAR